MKTSFAAKLKILQSWWYSRQERLKKHRSFWKKNTRLSKPKKKILKPGVDPSSFRSISPFSAKLALKWAEKWILNSRWADRISQRLQDRIKQHACAQIYPLLLFLPKAFTSSSSVQIFHPHQYSVPYFWFSQWTSPFTKSCRRSTLW